MSGLLIYGAYGYTGALIAREAVPSVVSRTSVLAVRGMPPQVKTMLATYRKLRV